GLYGNRNILALSVCLLLPAVVTYHPRSVAGQILKYPVALGLLAFMVLPESATSIITALLTAACALVVGAISWLVRTHRRMNYPRRRLRLLLAYVGCAAACAVSAVVVNAAFVRIPEALGRDTASLSGRIDVWRAVIGVWRADRSW